MNIDDKRKSQPRRAWVLEKERTLRTKLAVNALINIKIGTHPADEDGNKFIQEIETMLIEMDEGTEKYLKEMEFMTLSFEDYDMDDSLEEHNFNKA